MSTLGLCSGAALSSYSVIQQLSGVKGRMLKLPLASGYSFPTVGSGLECPKMRIKTVDQETG